MQERRGAHQVIRNDAEADPSSRAVRAVIATAPQAVPSFDHADAAFAADAPALSAPKPSLSFMRAPRRRFPSGPRPDDASHAPLHGRVFVLGRGKVSVAGGDVWWAVKQRDMAIERRHPQRHVGGSPLVYLVGRDDLMLRFLNRARFFAHRVTPAHDWPRTGLAPKVWLLCERDLGTTLRTKYYVVDMPPSASLKAVLRLLQATMLWYIPPRPATPARAGVSDAN